MLYVSCVCSHSTSPERSSHSAEHWHNAGAGGGGGGASQRNRSKKDGAHKVRPVQTVNLSNPLSDKQKEDDQLVRIMLYNMHDSEAAHTDG